MSDLVSRDTLNWYKKERLEIMKKLFSEKTRREEAENLLKCNCFYSAEYHLQGCTIGQHLEKWKEE